MKNTKNIIAFILLFFMAALVALPSLAFRFDDAVFEEAVRQPDNNVTISADPAQLSSAGYVTITIRLQNTNSGSRPHAGAFVEPREASTIPPETDPSQPPVTRPPVDETPPPSAPPSGGAYTNISIVNDYGVTFATSDVPAGTTGVFTGRMMVSDALIGTPLSFTIYWLNTENGNSYYKTLSVTVQHSGTGSTAYLRLTRTVSTSRASAGEEVELTYTMVNTGARKLNNITLVDRNIAGSGAMLTPFSLASGEQKVFTYTYTMRGSSVVTKPVATFVPEGSSTSLSTTCSQLTIGLVTAQLTKSVTVGTPTPEGVAFTLYLTNNGSQSLVGLSVKDDLGNTLASGFSLAIGESKIIEHFVRNPETVRNVSFQITGTYSSGKEFTDSTRSYPVHPYIDPATLGIKFTAEVRKPVDSENNIGLVFSVLNTGRVTYTNVVLTERELGYAIHEIPSLAPGDEATSFNVDLNIGSPRELVFILTAVDPSGNTHSYEAHINASRPDLESAIPNATPNPNGNGGASIVDLDVDRQISDKGALLMKWWKLLKIIFFISLGVIAVLAAVEAYLYFGKRRRHN